MKIILTPEEYKAAITKMAQDCADEGQAWVDSSRQHAAMFAIVAGFLAWFSFSVSPGIAFTERFIAVVFMNAAVLVLLQGRRIQRRKLAERQALLEQMRANLIAAGYKP